MTDHYVTDGREATMHTVELWYVVDDDVNGGLCISTAYRPMSLLFSDQVVAERVHREAAHHIVGLHNSTLKVGAVDA